MRGVGEVVGSRDSHDNSSVNGSNKCIAGGTHLNSLSNIEYPGFGSSNLGMITLSIMPTSWIPLLKIKK
jgi:hypothetical protein